MKLMRAQQLPLEVINVWLQLLIQESQEGLFSHNCRYSILHRNFSKIEKLNTNCYLLSSGMVADVQGLRQNLDEKLKVYEGKMDRRPNLSSMSMLLSKQTKSNQKGRTLYGRRFFPFYTFNLLAGLDEHGEPWVMSYDALGSYETSKVGCSGSGVHLMAPMLDNQFRGTHFDKPSPSFN